MAKKHSKTKEPIGVFADGATVLGKGRKPNEVEKLLVLAKHLIERDMKDGFVGRSIPCGDDKLKVKHENALRTLDRLYSHLGYMGCFTHGLCKTCKEFDTSTTTTKNFGTCRLHKDKFVHMYNTCDQHDKSPIKPKAKED